MEPVQPGYNRGHILFTVRHNSKTFQKSTAHSGPRGGTLRKITCPPAHAGANSAPLTAKTGVRVP